MNKTPDRREFLRRIGLGGISLSLAPTVALAAGEEHTLSSVSAAGRRYNGTYTGEQLNRVSFPMGGMGAGMICLDGTGSFSHLSIRNRPDVFNEPGIFAALHVKGIKGGARVVEGPSPLWKHFGRPDSGNGSGGNVFGLPRFRNVSFESRFPFATVQLSDDQVPVTATVTGWSPFIPNQEDDSSLPFAGVEYSFTNKSAVEASCVFSVNTRNFMRADGAKGYVQAAERGFVLGCESLPDKPTTAGAFAVVTDQQDTVVDHCWFRGGWFDPLTIAWEKIRDGRVEAVPPVADSAPGASLYVPFRLASGSTRTIRISFCWYVPETDLRFGEDAAPDQPCNPEAGCCNTTAELGVYPLKTYTGKSYKPWYASRFEQVEGVTRYIREHYARLRQASTVFSDAFYASTLPAEVTEAVAANLTILKSPTVMRQYDGRLWAFEGCGDTWGCCHGSCTHVWNYAQAIPHLFPFLERTLRHTEFCENQQADGHQVFRAALPIRVQKHDFHSAADGQLGGIMKLYRDWRISGDANWLKKMYPMAKVSMDYCIRTWDPGNKGIVEEPHHNTYDIEFWGPDGMCTSFYLGALMAMVRMGTHLKKDVKRYQQLLDAGRKYLETELFNGEYFIQQIKTEGLQAKSPLDPSYKTFGGAYSTEAQALLEREGPKYQYGTGCLSDGILGSWMARVCGLDEVAAPAKVASHLVAVHRYNLKSDLSEHANPQRPSFALGSEGGLLLCTWPRGGALSLPFVYSDEVWTGIEYQVASHLMMAGKVNEGLDIVRACRDRYDGRVRNPFNEYECGHWYARAMSSYGLIQGLTGLRYDAVDQTLYVDSKVGDFTAFLSTQSGFGTVTFHEGKPVVKAAQGTIPVKRMVVSGKEI